MRWLFLQQSYRGDVRCIMGTPHIKHMWQEVPVRWFRWTVVLSIPWAQRGDHINLCESRGRCLSIKLRARHRQLHRSLYLHLLDSQVNLYQSAKGRTGSRKMMHILRKSSAHLLACGLRDINGYTRSDCNPADKASRDVKRWKQFQRARRLKATPPTAERGAREGAWPRAG